MHRHEKEDREGCGRKVVLIGNANAGKSVVSGAPDGKVCDGLELSRHDGRGKQGKRVD